MVNKIKKENFLKKIENQIIVSSHAVDNDPLNNVTATTLIIKSAIEGGAKVLKLGRIPHIKSVMQATDLPIIGMVNNKYDNSDVYVTPTIEEVDELAKLNIKCIAIDATDNKRPKETLEEILSYTKEKYPDICLLADCATISDIINANELGFDLVSTSMRGHTENTKGKTIFDNEYEFVKEAVNKSNVPVIVEGSICQPNQVKQIMDLNVFAVVVGNAITQPKFITERFLSELKKKK